MWTTASLVSSTLHHTGTPIDFTLSHAVVVMGVNSTENREMSQWISGVLMLYLAVKFDSSHLCEVYVTSGKDETCFFMAEFPYPFSYWNSQSPGELSDFSALQLTRKQLWALSHIGTVLQLQLSDHPHLPLCYQLVTSGLPSQVLVMWKGGKEQQALHELEGASCAFPVLTQSHDLTFPSSSATLPLQAGKLIFLLVLSALPKCISCMKRWDRFLSNTYGHLSKTQPQRVLTRNKAIQGWLSLESTASS